MEMGHNNNNSAQKKNKIKVGFSYKIWTQIKFRIIHMTSAPKSTALLSEFALHVFITIVALWIIWNMRQNEANPMSGSRVMVKIVKQCKTRILLLNNG